MKLLANENFPAASVKYLREIGYDIISIGEDNPSNSDTDVINLSNEEKRTILTFDRDYGELIFKFNLKANCGVIYLRLDKYDPEEPGKIIDELLKNHNLEPSKTLTVYDGNSIRQRRY